MSASPPPSSSATDWQLVQQTLAGDSKAFEWLVVKYQPRVERLIARFVRDPGLVQDIAQESFIKAYRALGSFRGDAQFYTWLYRIVVNTAKKSLAERKKDPIILESDMFKGDEEETFLPDLESNAMATPEAELASRQIAEAVNQALDALPDDLRQALVLREMEGLSYEEIASLMGTPIGTVRSRIFRAREAISQKIRPMLDHQAGKRW